MTSDTPNTSPQGQSRAAIAAHIISDVLSPLLVPSYAMAFALWLTLMRFLPLGVKWWALGGVFFITAVIPALTIFVLIRLGRVSDTSISNRSERTLPYSVSILCFFGAGLFIYSCQGPAWLSAFYYGAGTVSLLSLAITRWWKISAHTAGISGFATAIYWMAYHGLIYSTPLAWVNGGVLLTGLVAWARLYLNHHTPLQTLAGAALAAAVVYTALSLSIA